MEDDKNDFPLTIIVLTLGFMVLGALLLGHQESRLRTEFNDSLMDYCELRGDDRGARFNRHGEFLGCVEVIR